MQTKSTIEQVAEFHRVFEHPIHDRPEVTNVAVNTLRVSLIREEADELEEALESRDPVAVLDALTDLQYVLDGAYLALGLHRHKEDAFAEVHRSNMSKLGADGKPIRREDGKTLKGPNFTLPDLAAIIANHA